MNPEISDEQFVPFLHDLGVDTHKQSFEWMLNDPNFSGVLRWMYKNLDHNNALTAREEFRYKELEKEGCLLSPEDLETSLSNIKDEYPGICIPGEEESREEMELDVKMLKERLHELEKHEMVINKLIRQNELIDEKLTLELTQLNAAYQQCVEDEGSAADECISLAQEIEAITDNVIEVIGDNMEVYASCKKDKDVAARFLTFAPLEMYKHTQALFRSHSDLYVSKNLVNNQKENTDNQWRATLLQANNMEERLSKAAFAYIISKADLCGEQAKLNLVSNYDNVHSSQIPSVLVETKSALQLIEQEESILEQQIQTLARQLGRSHTAHIVTTLTTHALGVRQHTLNSLTHLVDMWQRAFSLDKLLYLCLRRELRTMEEFLVFATQLSQYVVTENQAVSDRITSMSEIIADQESRERQLQSPLNRAMFALVAGEGASREAAVLGKLYTELRAAVEELTEAVDEGYRSKEAALADIRKCSRPLREHIWDGCTKQPNCWDRTVATMNHSLKYEMEIIEKRVVEAGSLFTSVKNGDKQNLRKLWQWFLTDPARLLAAIKAQAVSPK